MDKLDREILKILQSDARTSLKSIASQINLSLPATSERLRKLEQSGCIQKYTAILDATKFDKLFYCFCFITLDPKYNEAMKASNTFLAFCAQHTDILECHCIAGDHEYVLKIVTKSVHTLNQLLNEMRMNYAVIKSKTYTVLSTAKENHSISPE